MSRYIKCKSVLNKYLMFAIWSLQKKFKRVVHFGELMSYLSCDEETLRKAIESQYSRIRTKTWDFFLISDPDYIPMYEPVAVACDEGNNDDLGIGNDYGYNG